MTSQAVAHLDVTCSVHSSLRVRTIDNLLKCCQNNAFLFYDKQFGANSKSLRQDPPHAQYKGEWESYDWERPATVLKSEYSLFGKSELAPGDIRQGKLGDCYLLCSIASLAEQPSLIRRLFYYKELNKHGIIGVWLFIDGKWRLYAIDEQFPTRRLKTGELGFAFSYTKENELWVMAIEKAYAKAYGSYFDIVGGLPMTALRDLTGAPYQVIENMADQSLLKQELAKAVTANFIIAACSISQEGTSKETKLDAGIQTSHAYSILDARDILDSKGTPWFIIQLRNPWGKFEWNGEFSDASPLWTEQLRKELKVEVKDDGVFWMPLSKFTQFYQSVFILKVLPGYINNCLKIERLKGSSRYLVRLRPKDVSKLSTLTIDQVDARSIDNPAYVYSYFRMTLGRLGGDTGIEYLQSVISCDRNVFLEAKFEPVDYVVLVEVYWLSDLPRSFTLGTYSNVHFDIECVSSESAAYSSAEHMLWQSYCLKNSPKMRSLDPLTPVSVKGGKSGSDLQAFVHSDVDLKLKVIRVCCPADVPNSQRISFEFAVESTDDVIASSVKPGRAELLVNPDEFDILLFKCNPLNTKNDLRVSVAEVRGSPTLFPRDRRGLDLVLSHVEIAGVERNFADVGKSQLQRQQEELLAEAEMEAMRLSAQANYEAAAEEKEKSRAEFLNNQLRLLEAFNSMNLTQQLSEQAEKKQSANIHRFTAELKQLHDTENDDFDNENRFGRKNKRKLNLDD